jgi:dimethylhistidine N-methyltransferase
VTRARTARASWRSESEPDDSLAQFAADVEYYLTLQPRQLPSRYLYDSLGSALFEAICRLPSYRITAAERQLLTTYGEEVLQRAAPLSTMVELGPGSGEKLRRLLESRPPGARPCDVHLIDVSPTALELSARTLGSIERVRVWTHHARYETGLAEVTRDLAADERVLVLFLGSNIGNFDPPGTDAFLGSIRSQLRAGDALLVGADLVKPEVELLAAYDDPLGVTAAFNRNLLVRINRELGGNFDLGQFAHRAVWNAVESRIEMHLVARRAQAVQVRAAGIAFAMAEGESIWTESSYKYRRSDIADLLGAAGFQPTGQWLDREARFALTLAEVL